MQNLIAFTQKLIQTPSLSGDEKAVADLILAEMRTLGFDYAEVDKNGSVVGWIEGAQPGPTLLLDAHCDTVGVVNENQWSASPFSGQIVDDAIYGRGATDMKGALAAMIYAAAGLSRKKLTGRVVISASVLEEVLEGVALKPIMEVVKPDFVLIGEATQLNLAIGGRGRAEIHIETIGKPAHSSSPKMGVNAVHLMRKVISAVEGMPKATHPILGEGILTLTDIISDPYPGYSVVPARCRVSYDQRLLPGETREGVLGFIQTLPELSEIPFEISLAKGEHASYSGEILGAEKFFSAWMLDELHPLAQKSLRGLRADGIPAQMGAYQFCTNAAYSAGIAGIPTIGFGPGKESDAHVVDERIQIADLQAASKGYAAIMRAMLSAE